jgi:signal recognition particle receptor subunit beta
MPSIDVKKGRIDSKIVYYGPGQSGKTSCIRYIYDQWPAARRGKLSSRPMRNDPSLHIDVLPIRYGRVLGFNATFHLCSGPGLASAISTRRFLLRDTDGVVFVADSQVSRRDANMDSMQELQEILTAEGLSLSAVPHVLQYNKRDLDKVLTVQDLRASLNRHAAPDFETSAETGKGILEALEVLVKGVGEDLEQRL